ncbi:MAG TPA: hypothetical protein VI612_05435 [Candidatus Nanoarchaeia archaeon]|nr:hypothetical protein [Candidatus Nanoarchaeia archaeon]
MEFVMKATFVLTIVNIVLLLLLTYLYGRNWARMRTSFTAGLLLFTLAFLVQYGVSLYCYFTGMESFVEMAGMNALVVTGLQTIAFTILNAISWS